MIQANRNVASFNTIIAILQNDQSKIKLIRKYENTRKKIINNECAILFNKTCICIYIYNNCSINVTSKIVLFPLRTFTFFIVIFLFTIRFFLSFQFFLPVCFKYSHPFADFLCYDCLHIFVRFFFCHFL